MTTALILLLVLAVVIPNAAMVYLIERRTADVDRVPFAGLFDDLRAGVRRRSAMASRASGPDADRIDTELRILEQRHRECA